jgi:hypothetical protein
MIFAAPVVLPIAAESAPATAETTALPPVSAPPSAPSPEPVGWVGIGGRNAFGLSGPVTPDFGGDLFGGLWLLHDHVQPLVLAGWSRGASSGLIVDAFRLVSELALGSAFFTGHLWVGGTVGLGAESVWGHRDASSTEDWAAVFSASGLAEARIAHRLLIGLECGPEIAAPTTHFVGPSGQAPWSSFRLNAGLRLGVLFDGGAT